VSETKGKDDQLADLDKVCHIENSPPQGVLGWIGIEIGIANCLNNALGPVKQHPVGKRYYARPGRGSRD
jgi:hypothetical protein